MFFANRVDFRVLHAAWSPNGKLVVTAGTVSAPARLWDAASGRLWRSLGPPGSGDADFSPDGSLVATVGSGGFVHIWKVASGRFLLSIRASGPGIGSGAGTREVSSVRFSPDGRRLLTAALDGTARIFNIRRGKQLAAMAPHDDLVTSAAWSPDGREVITASDDRTARLWDPGGGGQVQILRGHGAAVKAAQFSPDARVRAHGRRGWPGAGVRNPYGGTTHGAPRPPKRSPGGGLLARQGAGC